MSNSRRRWNVNEEGTLTMPLLFASQTDHRARGCQLTSVYWHLRNWQKEEQQTNLVEFLHFGIGIRGPMGGLRLASRVG